jgi:hypothetical protein
MDASTSRPLPAFTSPARYDLDALERYQSHDESIQTLVAELRYSRAFVLRVLIELRERLEVEKVLAGVPASAEPARREQVRLTTRIALDFDGLPDEGQR